MEATRFYLPTIDFDPAKCGTEDCTFQDWDEWFSVSMEFNELPSGNTVARLAGKSAIDDLPSELNLHLEWFFLILSHIFL